MSVCRPSAGVSDGRGSGYSCGVTILSFGRKAQSEEGVGIFRLCNNIGSKAVERVEG